MSLYDTVWSHQFNSGMKRHDLIDSRPSTHGQANVLHGRVLAKLGRAVDAEAAFEEAVSVCITQVSAITLCPPTYTGRGWLI